MRVLRPLCIALSLCTAMQSNAVFAEEPSSLIHLGPRIFDMRSDPDLIVRTDDFIPITEVDWIYEATEHAPDLEPSVIHIRYLRPLPPNRKRVWLPDTASEPVGDDFPDALKPVGFDVIKKNSGAGLLVLPNDSKEYFALCLYSPLHTRYDLCTVTIKYRPDPSIELYVRLYRRDHIQVPDFRAVARKVHNFVYCVLDVTDAVKAETWEQRTYLEAEDDLPAIEACAPTIS